MTGFVRTMPRAGMGSPPLPSGDPASNMACFLDPTCRAEMNAWCYPLGGGVTSACDSWMQFNPTPAQIAANNTNAGPALTPANQALATQMAETAVAADIAKNPQNYDALCGTGLVPSPVDGSCVACPFYQTPSNGVCVFSWIFGVLVVGGLIGAGLLISAVKR